MTRCPLAPVLAACAALVASPVPRAGAEVVPTVDAVACTPGGVAAVPLSRAAGEPWPARVAAAIGDLRATASVVWVGTAAPDGVRGWTRAPGRVTVRAVEDAPAGEPPESTGAVFALLEMPASGEGALEVAGRAVRANWLPLPARVRADAAILPVAPAPAEDRPDPGTPDEYWRWSLLAASQGMRVGDPRGAAPERLWARHVEGLWRGGLERVRRASQGVHDELVESLVAVAKDRETNRDVAAWIARPSELRSLLAILIDAERGDQDVAQAALSWLRARWTVTAWVEADAGERVRLALANPTSGERVLRFTWVGAPADAVPVAVPVPPRSVVRAWIDRAALPPTTDAVNPDRLRAEQLAIADGTLRTTRAVGGREYPVRPPGLAFGAFLPPLTLADAQAGTITPCDAAWATSAWLRRRQGHWELFVDCMRPAGAPEPDADEVALVIGDPADPMRTVRVRASGALTVDGGGDDGTAAGFLAWPDRWRARIEIPEAWLPSETLPARPMMLAVLRTPGAGLPRQTAALALPAWTPQPAPVLVDLGTWRGIER